MGKTMRHYNYDIDQKTGSGLKTYLAILIVLAALLFAAPAGAVSLRSNTVIEGNSITLGDVFYDLKHNADYVLGPAPRPGKDMVLNARTLYKIAKALDVSWYPQSAADQIVLSSAATIVDAGMIEDMIVERIHEEGMTGKLGLTVSDGQSLEMILPQDSEASAEIHSLKIDHKRDRFEAVIVAPSKDNPIKTSRFRGRIERMIDVPVLSETLSNGTIIGERDIQMITMPAKSVAGQDMIIAKANLIGMTPRRNILSGKPIKPNDLQAPLIVNRGESVTMTFSNGPLRLTALGKALSNGSKGDIISVVNMDSNRTVEAVVTGAQEVKIQTF